MVARGSIRPLAALGLLVVLGAGPPDDVTTTPLGPGTFVRAAFQARSGAVQTQAAVFARDAVTLRVTDAPAALVGRQVSASLGRDGIAAISGGFFFGEAYKADGLIELDGVVRSPASAHFSGVVASGADGSPMVVATAGFDPASARDAVQDGPFLVDPGGTNGIRRDPLPPQRRALVVLSDDRIAFVLTSPVKLDELAEALVRSPQLFGVARVERALNVCGAACAGFAVRPPGGALALTPERIRIRTVLTLVPRAQPAPAH